MKKLFRLACIALVPFISGIVLLMLDNPTCNRIGSFIMSIGMPVTLFLLVVIGIIFMITGRLDDNYKPKKRRGSDVTGAPDESGEAPQVDTTFETAAEREARELSDINSAYGAESQYRSAEYQISHVAKNYKHASPKERVLGWLFFGFLMAAFGLGLVSILMGWQLGFFIGIGVFGGTIIISAIVKVILEKTSISTKFDIEKYETTNATVKACLLSSMSSTGGSHNQSTVRVRNVTYRIVLDVDGKEFNAYSKIPYDEGQKVEVAVKKNGRGVAKILDDLPDDEVAERIEAGKERIMDAEADLNMRLAEAEKQYREKMARLNAERNGEVLPPDDENK